MQQMNDNDAHGDPEGFVFDASSLRCSASLVLLVKSAADALERAYPGWLWAIQPDERGGVVNILSMRLSGKWGYTLLTSRLQVDLHNRAVLKAGGELLERFGFRAGAYDRDAWRHSQRDLGQLRADVSDQSRATQRQFQTQRLKAAIATGHARITTDANIGEALRRA